MGNCKSDYHHFLRLRVLFEFSYLRGICLAASSQRYRYEYVCRYKYRYRYVHSYRYGDWEAEALDSGPLLGTKANRHQSVAWNGFKNQCDEKIERVICVLSVSISIYLFVCFFTGGIGNSESLGKRVPCTANYKTSIISTWLPCVWGPNKKCQKCTMFLHRSTHTSAYSSGILYLLYL